MFLTRTLTAVVLLATFISALIWLDRTLFAVLISVVIGAGAYEWWKLIGFRQAPAVVYGGFCAVLCFTLSRVPEFSPWICALAAVFWIVAVPYRLGRGLRPAPSGAAPYVGLMVLIPAGLATIALPSDRLLMFLGLIWISDTGAYLAGRAFGRRKLAPTISPGKTWEGVAGGAIGCVIYAIIWAVLDPDLRTRVQGAVWIPFLAGTLLLCALGIVGDLFESALKRQAGAKDSGRLLPGHGGVLDRIDSATAALPVALLAMQALART
ncbi:MAG: CDP-archaeol synthase [Candidatus Parcubacteria bacterium]|nr:CDP-archaeol synthase [Burkholderiales bacterium]